ncbi:protein FAM83B-like [Huso huso]|uniref:Protein FAM83B-like n=1 Tax=Huso huso TaxID=61971 RepID=A0ABR0ZYG1_HUSHU
MESLSLLSSLKGEFKPEDYILPHYKESYRLAIDALVDGGRQSYQEFLTNERLADFLSEEELTFITVNAEKPQVNQSNDCEDIHDDSSSTGTYWPVESDVETPDLDLGWPGFLPELSNKTNVDLFFHPPRQNCPTIKEVIRKSIQDARKVIALVMDVFTDVDIFKEIVDASVRGVPVYLLLDELQFQSFLTMAEKQVEVQRLRNMRVRTIKGQEYLCRSGAKFHGTLKQKFLMVDCHTVVYGSYSFMWSFEKINLSMVQVITGQLVECYDEEFRTLFARSTIPNIFTPENVALDVKQERWQNGTNTVCSYVSHSQPFERRDQLRHTLDTVYMKACGRQLNLTNNMGNMDNDDTYQQRTFGYRPGPAGLNIQNRIQQLQSAETSNYMKRHSYAGQKQETLSYVQNRASNFGSSNWNVAAENYGYGAPGRTDFMSKYNAFQGGGGEQFQKGRLTQPYLSSDMRKSFHGTDNHVRTQHQNMPNLEHTTKSFLRTWRIESYLNNTEFPLADSGDYVDYPAVHYDGLEGIETKQNQMYPMHSSIRSSLVFNSTIPEQPESNSFTSISSTSTKVSSQHNQANSSVNMYYPAVHRNPFMQTENRMRQDDFMQKKRNIQIYDDQKTNMNYVANKELFTPTYATLGRTSAKNPDVLQVEGYAYKRHSINEPNPSQDYSASKDNLSYMYGTLGRRQPDKYVTSQGDRYTQNRHAVQNLDHQRSTSEYSIKKEAENKTLSTCNWQPPPSRTVSVTSLANARQQEQNPRKANKESEGSPHFFKRSTKKIKSLLNLTDKSPKIKSGSNYKICDSSDTLVSDDEDQKYKKNKDKNKLSTSTANSVKSIDSLGHSKINQKLQLKENHLLENVGDSSAPRFSTEQLKYETDKEQKTNPIISPVISSTVVHHRPETSKIHHENSSAVSQALQRNRLSEKRVYSRFEPFCTFEKQSSKPTNSGEQTVTTGAIYTAEKNKSVFRDHGRTNSTFARHTSTGYPTYSHNDNKIGRFMQRFVGNLIHKHK